MPCTAIELMICCAARALEDGRTVAVGTGLPCAAAMLAQRTHAPNLVIMSEAGGVAPQLPTMPISVGDSRTFYRGLMAASMAEVMQPGQRNHRPAVIGFPPASKRKPGIRLQPGVTAERVRQATGFELDWAESPAVTLAPTAEELCLLREEVDPFRYLLGRPC